jgi:hypothetical protein
MVRQRRLTSDAPTESGDHSQNVCRVKDLVADTSPCRLIVRIQKTILNDAQLWERTPQGDKAETKTRV